MANHTTETYPTVEGFSKTQTTLIDELWLTEVFRHDGTGGIHLDPGALQSRANAGKFAVYALKDLLRNVDYTHVAAASIDAMPVAALLWGASYTSFLTLSESLENDARPAIVGKFRPHQRVIIVDYFLRSTGKRVLTAARTLTDAGLVVAGIVALVDTGEGGDARVQEAGYPLHTVFQLKPLLDYSARREKIDPEDAPMVLVALPPGE